VGKPLAQPQPGELGIGELDDKGIPKTIDGYERLNAIIAATDKNLTEILFGEEGSTIQIRSPSEAAELVPIYVYDPESDTLTSQETGTVYQNLRGTYTSPKGEQIRPGFIETIGLDNFKAFFISPALRGPLVRLTMWNFAFAF
jgi:arabinogalactan oligomer/maltooligosaccharide transport system permease protein